MNLIRFTARALLSSYFIAQGLGALKNPEQASVELQGCLDSVKPLADKVLPADLAAKLPEQGADLVKVQGVAQMAAGLGFGVNLLRRPAAGVLAATMVPKVLASLPKRGEKTDVGELVTNLALFGAAVLAAFDTEGKPSLVWQARTGVRVVKAEVTDKKTKVAKLSRKARKLAASQAAQVKDAVA
jgi:uncharacterized membrane protein YphA (DoxX/SURF4 family)